MEVLVCKCNNDAINLTVVKVDGMYSIICHRLKLPSKVDKYISYYAITWKFSLDFILEIKRIQVIYIYIDY